MKITEIINKYLNTENKKTIASCVVAALFITCGGGILYLQNKALSLVLNKNKFTIEYGKSFNANFKTLVNTKDLNKEYIHYLQRNVKIKSNIKNEVEIFTNEDGTTSEKDKGYAKVGDYKITLTYKNKDVIVTVKVRDTVAPELTVPENMEVVQGTDLTTFDFKSLITATDLAQLNDIQIDYSTVDVNTPAEYTAKASVEDVNKNKTEKEFKITVIAASTDQNTETTTEIVTDQTMGQKKSVVITKSKTNTPADSNSSTNNNRSSSNSSNNNSSNSGNSGVNTGGNTETKPSELEKTIVYWVKCDCGFYIESTIFQNEVLNKIKKHVEDNLWTTDKCSHYNYGYYEK